MPGALGERDVLDQFPVAADEEVTGELEPGDGSKVGMGPGVEAVLEEGVDPGAAELAWRQADPVNHQEVHLGIRRPFVPVGGGNLSGLRQPGQRHEVIAVGSEVRHQPFHH